MPYQPYNYQWVSPYSYYQQPAMPQQQRNGVTKVNGPDSALQIFVPPNGQSEPIFDYNGYQFYIVSADGAGTKTLETFDFFPHKEDEPEPLIINGVQFESQQEYDKIMTVVNAAMEVRSNGVHGPVSAADDKPTARHAASSGA